MERDHAEERVVGAHTGGSHVAVRLHAKVPVRARHPLGAAGRAGGVLVHGVVVRGAGVRRAGGPALDERRERHRGVASVAVGDHLHGPGQPRGDRRARLHGLRSGDDGPHPAVAEVELELGLLERRVERNGHRPGAEDRQEADCEGGYVRKDERHPVAGLHAALHQRRGKAVDPPAQLGVGDPLVAVHERHATGEGGGALVEHLRHGSDWGLCQVRRHERNRLRRRGRPRSRGRPRGHGTRRSDPRGRPAPA